jgi:hypothetical protein
LANNFNQDTDASAGLLQVRDDAYKKLSTATDAFQAVSKKAKAAWQDSFDYPGVPMYQWIVQNYPMFSAAENDQAAASSAFDNVMNQIYGSNYKTLDQMKKNLELALQQRSSAYAHRINKSDDSH